MSSGSFQLSMTAQVCILRGLEEVRKGWGVVRGTGVQHRKQLGDSICTLSAEKKEKKPIATALMLPPFFHFFLIWSLQVMSARLSSWDSRPSVPARAGRGARIKSPPLHLILSKTFSEARLEPCRDYLTSPSLSPPLLPPPRPAVGRQPSPPKTVAFFSCI